MSENQSGEVRLEDEEPREEEGKVITLRIDLSGPMELLSWMKQNNPLRARKRLMAMMPAEFKRHVRAAQREQLLALRSLLDITIERLGTEEKPARKATSVEVE